MFAVIPYTTFPTIELGPLTLRTFGLFVALGVLVGAWLAAGYAERFGVERDETYRVATWMVLAGIVGARLTWAATHTDQIDEPLDVIAIWEGGIQFSGGFIAALIVGLPFFRRWTRLQRWRVLDGYAWGLAIGLALGRVGCYSVGEHFGRTSNFFLATRYDGGEVREPTLGDVPLQVGTTFHNTSLYELLYLVVLFTIMGLFILRARRAGHELAPGLLTGLFVLVYGVARFASDSLRVNDERVGGLTGAQWMAAVMVPAGAFILWRVRPRLAALAATTTEVPVSAAAEALDADAEPTDADVEPIAEVQPAGADAEGAGADAEPAGADAEPAGADVAPMAEVQPARREPTTGVGDLPEDDAPAGVAADDPGPVSSAEVAADADAAATVGADAGTTADAVAARTAGADADAATTVGADGDAPTTADIATTVEADAATTLRADVASTVEADAATTADGDAATTADAGRDVEPGSNGEAGTDGDEDPAVDDRSGSSRARRS
ncbi:MAG TPA: prolipoprotein diacylglyceryl transferase family protein [Acidimicrobiales bacterium]|nr:prolipoprotein diacylglyceryl transferase family protein [Acidimicrobiales bacterium]